MPTARPPASHRHRHRPRRSDVALLVLAGLALGLVASLALGLGGSDAAEARLERNRALVARLELTDLSLFTEARYTRHLTQADLHTPFQDAPMSLDHFPSGSVVGPPAQVTGDAELD